MLENRDDIPLTRTKYILLICIIILLGLYSRRIPRVPLYVGDLLWVLMIFFIVRVMFIRSNIRFVVAISLSICYMIEFSQLYQADWMNQIRGTPLGGLVLGHGFLWSDILAYTIGIGMGMLFQKVVLKR